MNQGPFKMGTIARLSGFSPEVLRAWERRYGFLGPARGAGGQRLYDDEDLRLLVRVRELLDEGRSIGEIAQLGRERLLQSTNGRAGFSPPGIGPADAGPSVGRQTTQTTAWCERVVDAAIAMDSATLSSALDEAFAAAGPERTIHDVIEAAARQIGDLWRAGACSVASEHLASDIFTHRVRRMFEDAQPAAKGAPRIVAACFPDEHHQLGLLILAWHLARRGFRVDYLGPSFPLSNLEQACEAASPHAVLLSVARKVTYRRHRDELAALVARRSFRWPVYVGGQGAVEEDHGARPGAHVFDAGTDLARVLETIAGVPA